MNKPTKEELRVAMHKLFERMAEAGWMSRIVATHDTAQLSLTEDGKLALRAFRRLLLAYQSEKFSEVDLVAFLEVVRGDDLAFLDEPK